MLAILQFIFSSFWIWIGSFLFLIVFYLIMYNICNTVFLSIQIKYKYLLELKGKSNATNSK
jgi:hypothetical protein